MIDNNYENISNEINEEFLDENIPRDLLALYRWANPYASQRNPSTQHIELRSVNRRSKLYDYGKAEYRVISAEDAIQMVKNNKHDAQNLRIIFEGDLVEYELRDNGSIYAIYRSGDRVVLNGKVYKNVGYAPWQQVIRASEKIYWTDEYSRKLSPEEIAKRNEKDAERVLYRGLTPKDPNYDAHRPYNNLTRGKVITTKAIPDTGKHADKDDDISSKYIDYDLARKALKKLELEKADYDEEEYEELKAKFELLKKEAFDDYNALLNRKKIQDTKKVKEIDLYTHRFNVKLAEYTRAIQTALTNSYILKKKIDDLMITTANNDREISLRLSRMRGQINSVISSFKDDTQRLEGSEADHDNANTERLKEILAELTEYKTNYVNTHLAKLLDLERKTKEIEEVIATYRPNAAAKKARNAAAQTKELSDELLNVVEFTNF